MKNTKCRFHKNNPPHCPKPQQHFTTKKIRVSPMKTIPSAIITGRFACSRGCWQLFDYEEDVFRSEGRSSGHEAACYDMVWHRLKRRDTLVSCFLYSAVSTPTLLGFANSYRIANRITKAFQFRGVIA